MNEDFKEGPKELYHISEVKELLGCSESTVRRIAKRLVIKAWQGEARCCFKKVDVRKMQEHWSKKRQFPDRDEGTFTAGELGKDFGKLADTIRKAIKRAARKYNKEIGYIKNVTHTNGIKVDVLFLTEEDAKLVKSVLRAGGKNYDKPYKRPSFRLKKKVKRKPKRKAQ